MLAKTLYPWCQAPGLDPGFLSARCKCLEILRRLSPLGRNQYNIGALINRVLGPLYYNHNKETPKIAQVIIKAPIIEGLPQ